MARLRNSALRTGQVYTAYIQIIQIPSNVGINDAGSHFMFTFNFLLKNKFSYLEKCNQGHGSGSSNGSGEDFRIRYMSCVWMASNLFYSIYRVVASN